jgi:hypothetical protein
MKFLYQLEYQGKHVDFANTTTRAEYYATATEETCTYTDIAVIIANFGKLHRELSNTAPSSLHRLLPF